ncbi:MAG: ATP-dependent RNA helicase [Spirochaetales bacterium]|nr:ATP-dependent RNA helicase [Spirochaetales bacterium]
MNPKKLPVYKERDKILKALESNQVVIVESPTGSGKTTQIPLILHEAGYTDRGVIGITQPRRIATLSVSDYISRQLGVPISGFIGYKMRFEDKTTPETRLKIMTDGTLLQEMKTDPWLSKYSVLMVDEAHERSLNIDFILGLLKNILKERHEFRVIISSATLNTEAFSRYYSNAEIVSIDTPVYPVQVYYDPPYKESDDEALVEKITSIVERIVGERRKGDVLVFLSGEKIIKDTCASLASSAVKRRLQIVPLYGRLGREEQEKVFDKTPFGKTKVVVSTNIAETSVTIDGITTVIDSGLCKMNFYNPRTFTSSLVENPVSRASCNQRKGRAGRTQPGSCYRLYSPGDFDARNEYTLEEIYRTDLAEVVLRMAELGIEDFFKFDFISSPGEKGIRGAIETLQLLDALDENTRVTPTGQKMLYFPLMPRHARMIIEAVMRYPDVIREVVIATSFLSTNSPFLLPQGEEMEARRAHHTYADPNGDFVSYLRLFQAFESSGNKTKFCEKHYLDEKAMREIANISEQLESIVGDTLGVPVSSGGSVDDFLCACARGLIQFICIKSGSRDYRSLTTDKIIIHPGSVMFKEHMPFLMAGEIVRTSRMYARSVSPLRKEWLKRIDPKLAGRLMDLVDNKPKGKRRGDEMRSRDNREGRSKDRDTTNQLFVGDTAFPVIRNKNKKKAALFEWNKLYKALSSLKGKEIPDFQNMRGILSLDGMEVIPDGRVNMIFTVVRTLNPKRDTLQGFPAKTYDMQNPSHQTDLVFQLKDVLKLVMSGKRKKRSVGFLSLQTDGEQHYWFKSSRSFNQALNDSLESLEGLADQLSEDMDEEIWEEVNRSYRRLDKLYTY